LENATLTPKVSHPDVAFPCKFFFSLKHNTLSLSLSLSLSLARKGSEARDDGGEYRTRERRIFSMDFLDPAGNPEKREREREREREIRPETHVHLPNLSIGGGRD